MWIVKLALRRPYTFVVLALLILVVGPLAILRTPTDIFPNIEIPVVSVIWTYGGLSPQQMEQRIVSGYERSLTTSVGDIEHIESQSLNGVAVVKIFLQPGASVERALAEIAAESAAASKVLPPGAQPPLMLTYNASTVPILQLALSSKSLPEQTLYDVASTIVRTQLATVRGAAVPLPFGGKVRQVMVDIDGPALQARGLAPLDVVNAINAQSLILPAGTARIGSLEYDVDTNGTPASIRELNDLPVRTLPNGSVTYVHDVAQVHDGFAPQLNVVRQDGGRAALLQVDKSGSASTLDIVAQVKAMLPRLQAAVPAGVEIHALGDQSLFVTAAIDGVVRETVMAAALASLMILLFLGSWRSTLIIAATIPLSILASLTVLAAIGQTINIMTMGGLALAVGILVDDATVTIENIEHHLQRGAALHTAILDGAGEIAVPAFVSTGCICIVFLPMFLLTGVARFLFVPMAEAVVFAMIASYVLSRTLVPTLAAYLLRTHQAAHGHDRPGLARRFQRRFEAGFERVHHAYGRLLAGSLARAGTVSVLFLAFALASFALAPTLGRDFFPGVDTGQIRLHLRARTGLCVEETARLTDQVEARVRQLVPAGQVTGMLDNIGLPVSGINLTYSTSGQIGESDADVLVALAAQHEPTADVVRRLRAELPRSFPGTTFSFPPADIVGQILNFGAPAPIDVQVVGRDAAADRAYAATLQARLATIPGLTDLHIQQPGDQPQIHVDVDRTKAALMGFTPKDAANNLLVSLSGSAQTQPNFWLNPANGVSYLISTQTPQVALDSVQALANIPVTGAGAAHGALLGTLSTIRFGNAPAVVSHYNAQPVIDLYASAQDRDLGGVATDIDRVIASTHDLLPKGASVVVRGQVQTMRQSFTGLAQGMAFAALLVYLLMVVNFQSWTDPFVILSGLPVVMSGVVWMLFVSHTALSVPALTGAIMCVGIATANSILVVNFAREKLAAGLAPARAALEAGAGRFRPVLMTALAMIIGMLPMAIGLGEGGEQNAPLGRAVLGGLGFGTVVSLVFVPLVFALVHGWQARRRPIAGAVAAF
jgi:multidrug efflux pump subunit AcrB